MQFDLALISRLDGELLKLVRRNWHLGIESNDDIVGQRTTKYDKRSKQMSVVEFAVG